MKATIEWAGSASFRGTTDSNHTIVMDGPPDRGGQDLGPRPMEMMLLGLGGCTCFDVVDILKRGRAEVSDCRASITAERSDEIPAVFTQIKIHFDVYGHRLVPAKVQRAVDLTAEKYCSASIMLERGGVEIHHSFTIHESTENPS